MKKLNSLMLKVFDIGDRITGLNTSYLFRGGVWLGIAYVGMNLLSFIFTVLMTRLKDKIFFGKFQFVLAMAATFSFFFLPGINQALIKSVSKGFDRSVIQALKAKLTFGIGGILSLLGVSGYFLWIKEDPMLAFVFFGVALLFPFQTIISTLQSYFYGKQNFKIPTFISLAEKAVPVVISSIVLFFYDFPTFVLLYFGSIALINILLYLWFRNRQKFVSEDKEMVKYGIKLTITNIIPKFTLQIDRLFMAFFLGMEQLSIYAISLLFIDAIDGLFGMGQNLIASKLTATSPRTVFEKLKKLWLLWASLACTAVIILLIPFIFTLFFPEYGESIRLAQIYACVLPAMLLWKTINNWRVMTNRLKSYGFLMNLYYLMNALAVGAVLLIWKTPLVAIISRVAVIWIFVAVNLFILLVEMRKSNDTVLHE